MPSALTDYGKDYLIGTLFGGWYTKPGSFYMALCSQAPDKSADGTMLSEPDPSTGYSRIQFPNDTTVWSSPVGGTVTNLAVISFAVATAQYPMINHYALCDSATGGNVYLYGSLTMPRIAEVGHSLRFEPGFISIQIGSIQPTIIGS